MKLTFFSKFNFKNYLESLFVKIEIIIFTNFIFLKFIKYNLQFKVNIYHFKVFLKKLHWFDSDFDSIDVCEEKNSFEVSKTNFLTQFG